MFGTDWRGHAGLNLLVTSVAAILLGFGNDFTNKLIIFSTVMAALPDIDIRLEIPHRKYTHNIFFGLAAGVVVGYVFKEFGQPFDLGFWSVMVAVIIHILGDLMTYRSFNPIAPIGGKKKFSIRLFKSSNNAVNTAFLLVGAMAYYAYLMKFNLLPPMLHKLG